MNIDIFYLYITAFVIESLFTSDSLLTMFTYIFFKSVDLQRLVTAIKVNKMRSYKIQAKRSAVKEEWLAKPFQLNTRTAGLKTNYNRE